MARNRTTPTREMTKTGALDPGIRGGGVNVFDGGRLARATYLHNPIERGNDVRAVVALAHTVRDWLGPDAELLVSFTFERPRIYKDEPGRRKQKGDQNDLPPLYGIDCAVGALLPPWVEPITVYPDEWKNNVPPDAMCRRIWQALTPEERRLVPLVSSYDTSDEGLILVGGIDHNVLDSIGMNLKLHGRLERHRVLPG